MVKDPPPGMAAFEGHGDVLVGVTVKIDPHLLDQPQHVLRAFVD